MHLAARKPILFLLYRFLLSLCPRFVVKLTIMYDSFSSDYDRFVNWESRLQFEMPFLESQLMAANCERILDTATGTGMHVIELRKRGYIADGCDFSEGMIRKAVSNAETSGVKAEFKVARFGEIANVFADYTPYDAVLCLGNSLPHLLSEIEIEKTIEDFSSILRPGGLMLIQNRNFKPVLANHQRWMEPQGYQEGDREWLFLRFYDFEPDGLINFNVVNLNRTKHSSWTQNVVSTQLNPILSSDLTEVIEKSGFLEINLFGGMDGLPYRSESSGNLVIAAKRK